MREEIKMIYRCYEQWTDATVVEIERLRIENIQMRFALGYPMPAHLEYHIIPQNPFKCGTCDAKKRTSFVITDEIDD